MSDWVAKLAALTELPQAQKITQQRLATIDSVLATDVASGIAASLYTERGLTLANSQRLCEVSVAEEALADVQRAHTLAIGTAGERSIRHSVEARCLFVLASRSAIDTHDSLFEQFRSEPTDSGSALEVSLATARFVSIGLALSRSSSEELRSEAVELLGELGALDPEQIDRPFRRAYFVTCGRLMLDVVRMLWGGDASHDDLAIGLSRAFEFWLSFLGQTPLDNRYVMPEEGAVGLYEVFRLSEVLVHSGRPVSRLDDAGGCQLSEVSSYLTEFAENWDERGRSIFGDRNAALADEWLVRDIVRATADALRGTSATDSVWLKNSFGTGSL